MSCSEPAAFGDFQNNLPMRIARPAFGLRGDFKGLRQERVAREHGHAFAKDLVIRKFAAAIIVVVHRRQIVMHERVGMDALNGARERQGIGLATATCRRRREAQRGSHAFATSEQRITHGFVNGGGFGAFRR